MRTVRHSTICFDFVKIHPPAKKTSRALSIRFPLSVKHNFVKGLGTRIWPGRDSTFASLVVDIGAEICGTSRAQMFGGFEHVLVMAGEIAYNRPAAYG
jgi:hypothetical protein